MNFRFSNFIWGSFLLFAAIFLLTSNMINFENISAGGIIAAVFAVLVLVNFIAHLHIALIPIPLAVLYYIFQTPLDLPVFKFWILIAASVFAAIGLSILLPSRKRFKCSKIKKAKIVTDCDDDNNPSVNVNFGYISRNIQASSLETVKLSCNFGALQIYLDNAGLSPNGAEITLNCSFGAIEMSIPKHWNVIDRVNCSLGGVDMDKHFSRDENAPKLIINGSVSFGGIEIRAV